MVGVWIVIGPWSGGSARAQAVAFQPVVTPFPSGVTLDVTPTVSADRRYVRMGIGVSFTSLLGFDTYWVPAAVSGGGMNGTIGGLGGLGMGMGGGMGAGGGRGPPGCRSRRGPRGRGAIRASVSGKSRATRSPGPRRRPRTCKHRPPHGPSHKTEAPA